MYFPLFVDISTKNILVVGGGAVATRRIKTLLLFTERLTVIAPKVCAPLAALMVREKGIVLHTRRVLPEDIYGRDLVLVATDDETLNEDIAALCRRNAIPVNVCTNRALCDFQFPSIVTKEDVCIALNASGEDHGGVKALREQVQLAVAGDSPYDDAEGEEE